MGLHSPGPSQAFFFIIPIPNFANPTALSKLIDALEESDETKSVAYVSEDKTFGAKYWVWGHYAGHVPQNEADRIALSRCAAALVAAKAQTAGGKALYDFGSKSCELHGFNNRTVSARANEWRPSQSDLPQSPAPQNVAGPPAPGSTTAIVPAQGAAGAGSTPANSPTTAASAAIPAVSAPATPAAASASVAAESLPPQTPPPLQPSQGESAIAKRLRDLEALRKAGLITEAEYQEKRKAILAAL